MSSLPLLHLLAMLHFVTSPLKLKQKDSIHITIAGDPPYIARLPPSTAIKRPSQPWPLSPPLNHVSVLAPPWPKHHTIRAPHVAVVPFHCHTMPIVPLHNETHNDELADPLSIHEQLIGMWIHVKIYFEILQHRARLSTSSEMNNITSVYYIKSYKKHFTRPRGINSEIRHYATGRWLEARTPRRSLHQRTLHLLCSRV
jgi:hypothetical protein